jgi:hypothetical protein
MVRLRFPMPEGSSKIDSGILNCSKAHETSLFLTCSFFAKTFENGCPCLYFLLPLVLRLPVLLSPQPCGACFPYQRHVLDSVRPSQPAVRSDSTFEKAFLYSHHLYEGFTSFGLTNNFQFFKTNYGVKCLRSVVHMFRYRLRLQFFAPLPELSIFLMRSDSSYGRGSVGF